MNCFCSQAFTHLHWWLLCTCTSVRDVRALRKLGAIQRFLGHIKHCVIAGSCHFFPRYDFLGHSFLPSLRFFALKAFVFAGIVRTDFSNGAPKFLFFLQRTV